MDIWVSYTSSLFLAIFIFVFSFTGSAGVAIISKTTAYLVTDSRYWLQAKRQVDGNWNIIQAGDVGAPFHQHGGVDAFHLQVVGEGHAVGDAHVAANEVEGKTLAEDIAEEVS